MCVCVCVCVCVFPCSGGAYIIGDSWEAGLYDARALSSKHDVIVVTHNYRVNVLGFMAHHTLAQEDPDASTGTLSSLS